MGRFVISDIHGCFNTFNSLLNKIEFKKEDSLYLLGDYINRGPDSSGVLSLIIDLQSQGFDINPLRGNHEENMLKAYEKYEFWAFQAYVKELNCSGDLLDAEGHLDAKYKSFMETLPYYIELEDFWLVHAGFNTTIEGFMNDKNAMLTQRGFRYDNVLFKGKKVVHGHDVKYLDEINSCIQNDEMIIPLDNGCVHTKPHKRYDYTKTGSLLCLNLDSLELTSNENIDN